MKTTLFFIVLFSSISFLQAQKQIEDAKLEYKLYLSKTGPYRMREDGNYKALKPEEFAVVMYKKETGKFPNLKKQQSIEIDINDLYSKNEPENNLLNKITPVKFEKISGLFSELIECNQYNFFSYLSAINFYSKLYRVSKDEKYLKQIEPLYIKMKSNFAFKFDDLYQINQGFQDDVYQEIIENNFFTSQYEVAYKYCIEYLNTQTQFFKPLIENNKCENTDQLLLIPVLEYKLGRFDDSFKSISRLKDELIVKNVNPFQDLNFYYVYNLISFKIQNILTYDNNLFYNYTYGKQGFTEKDIDFVNSKNILPITNLSAKIVYSRLKGESNFKNSGNAFDLFLKESMNSKLIFWPVFCPLDLKNTPNLFSFLEGNDDVKLLFELGFLKNIIDIEKINGTTKIYFLEDFDRKIIGTFDIPKNMEGYKKIKITYFYFNFNYVGSDDLKFYIKKTRDRYTRNYSSINVVLGKNIKNLEFSKIDDSACASLQLSNLLTCDKIYEIKIKQEQTRRELENIRLAEEKRQEQLRIEEDRKQEQRRLAEQKKLEKEKQTIDKNSTSNTNSCSVNVDYNLYVVAESNGDLFVTYDSDSYGNQVNKFNFYWLKPDGSASLYYGKTLTDALRESPVIEKWYCQGSFIYIAGRKYHTENGKKDLKQDHWSDTFLKYYGQH